MGIEEIESAMMGPLYSALGESISYVGQESGTISTHAKVDTTYQDIGYQSQAAEGVTIARVRKSVIPIARRGDLIEMQDGTVYVVDSVSPLNKVEWELTLTERDR